MSADTNSTENCPICKESLSEGNVVQMRQRGANGINAASVQRGDSLVVTAGCTVHVLCRERYVNKKYIELSQRPPGPVEPRRSEGEASAGPSRSDTDCLFCGRQVTLGGSDYSRVKTDNFTRSVMQHCERRSDDWSLKVKARMACYGGEPHAYDCVYHHVCCVNFRSGLGVPPKHRDGSSGSAEKRGKIGRPKDADQEQAFFRMCAHLEMNPNKRYTLAKLEEKMKEYLNSEDSSPYTRRDIKVKLMEHFGDTLFIAEKEGLSTTVTLREKTSDILDSLYRDEEVLLKSSEEAQISAIIQTAARLIVSDIKDSHAPTDYYPKVDDLTLDSALNCIPESLRYVLTKICVGENAQQNVAIIGQAIVQLVRYGADSDEDE